MKTIAGLFAALALLTILGTARAEPVAVPAAPRARLAPDVFFVKTGLAGSTAAFSLGAGWDKTAWIAPYLPDLFSLSFELEMGHWRTFHPGAGTGEFTQFGVTPMLRLPLADSGSCTWFAEGGVGVHFIVPLYHTQKKRFSTSFNFQDLFGIGARFGAERRHEVVLYISHFSNAAINEPNPGENFLQLRYLRHFD